MLYWSVRRDCDWIRIIIVFLNLALISIDLNTFTDLEILWLKWNWISCCLLFYVFLYNCLGVFETGFHVRYSSTLIQVRVLVNTSKLKIVLNASTFAGVGCEGDWFVWPWASHPLGSIWRLRWENFAELTVWASVFLNFTLHQSIVKPVSARWILLM